MKCRFKQSLRTVFGVALLTLAATPAPAVVLSLVPASQTAMPSDSVSLDLVISGLGDFAPDSLGDFDIDIGYDPVALSLTGFSLGPFLGDIGLGEAADFSFGDLGGVVNLAEVSLLEPDVATCIFCAVPFLDDIQPDSFALATLEFMVDVLPAGTNTIVSIDTVNALGDGFGLPLTLDGTADAVIRNPVGVPEPSTLALLVIGLAGLFGTRRRTLTA